MMPKTFLILPSQYGPFLYILLNTNCPKKSLKIPKRQSESVNRRITDNTVAKRKSTKGQTTINKTYT